VYQHNSFALVHFGKPTVTGQKVTILIAQKVIGQKVTINIFDLEKTSRTKSKLIFWV